MFFLNYLECLPYFIITSHVEIGYDDEKKFDWPGSYFSISSTCLYTSTSTSVQKTEEMMWWPQNKPHQYT